MLAARSTKGQSAAFRSQRRWSSQVFGIGVRVGAAGAAGRTAVRWLLPVPARLLRRGMAGQTRGQRVLREATARKNTTFLLYVTATAVLVLGLSYAAVPLYRAFCQASGFSGTTMIPDSDRIAEMVPAEDRLLRIKFNADTGATMRWDFRPLQKEVYLVPGETSLAFYTATNPTDKPVIGISTYNVVPYDCGAYFNKIQCFCFEEQRLNPHEQVDMPVFFYIDPEFCDDPAMRKVEEITLSYTFFEAKDTAGLEESVAAGYPMPSDELVALRHKYDKAGAPSDKEAAAPSDKEAAAPPVKEAEAA